MLFLTIRDLHCSTKEVFSTTRDVPVIEQRVLSDQERRRRQATSKNRRRRLSSAASRRPAGRKAFTEGRVDSGRQKAGQENPGRRQESGTENRFTKAEADTDVLEGTFGEDDEALQPVAGRSLFHSLWIPEPFARPNSGFRAQNGSQVPSRLGQLLHPSGNYSFSTISR